MRDGVIDDRGELNKEEMVKPFLTQYKERAARSRICVLRIATTSADSFFDASSIGSFCLNDGADLLRFKVQQTSIHLRNEVEPSRRNSTTSKSFMLISAGTATHPSSLSVVPCLKSRQREA